jgi:hypothetical protein
VQKIDTVGSAPRPIPWSLILLGAFVVHGPLLLMKLPLSSYDTNFHIFFASHYAQHWFDPWNTKWYAGFSQTTYPPLPQQWLAVFSHVIGLDMAYMLVQFVAILLLAVGVYRFSLLWVDKRASAYAAAASVLLGSEALLVYSAGQLSTTFAAPLYLNALPFLYEWMRYGSKRSLIKGLGLSFAAAAAHHATLLFGSLLFAVPVFALAAYDLHRTKDGSNGKLMARTIFGAILGGIGVALVLLPFWMALLKYQVTQVPIPHPSRANYILSPEYGLNYFIVPYGAMILAFPFILWKGATVPRLRPLLPAFWITLLLGIGGTTPVAHLLLGRAFEVLTMERFTYWATLLALPFIGLLAKEAIDRYGRKAAIGLTLAAVLTCAGGIAWNRYRPADTDNYTVDSTAAWLNRDGHDKYRYLTLGFGFKIARLAVQTDASSVDGEWNSGRMLPELTEHGSGPLTSSKYFGKNGMEALTAILQHADKYGLKWVILRDPYYEPLLVFAGWRRVDDLDSRTITVWGRDGVPPAAPVNSPQMPTPWQGLMWGILPIGSSILAMLLLLIPDRRTAEARVARPARVDEDLALGRMVS